MSNTLSKAAKNGLNRLGDIICPQNAEFPSYSQLGAIEHVEAMLETAPSNDIKDLGLLLSILSFMPHFVLNWLVNTMRNSHDKNGALSSLFRQMDLGIRGIVLGTYYSGKIGSNYKGKAPLDIIGFSINRMEN